MSSRLDPWLSIRKMRQRSRSVVKKQRSLACRSRERTSGLLGASQDVPEFQRRRGVRGKGCCARHAGRKRQQGQRTRASDLADVAASRRDFGRRSARRLERLQGAVLLEFAPDADRPGGRASLGLCQGRDQVAFGHVDGLRLRCRSCGALVGIPEEQEPGVEVTSRMVASQMRRAVRSDVFAPEVQEFERGAGLIQAPLPNAE